VEDILKHGDQKGNTDIYRPDIIAGIASLSCSRCLIPIVARVAITFQISKLRLASLQGGAIASSTISHQQELPGIAASPTLLTFLVCCTCFVPQSGQTWTETVVREPGPDARCCSPRPQALPSRELPRCFRPMLHERLCRYIGRIATIQRTRDWTSFHGQAHRVPTKHRSIDVLKAGVFV